MHDINTDDVFYVAVHYSIIVYFLFAHCATLLLPYCYHPRPVTWRAKFSGQRHIILVFLFLEVQRRCR